MSHPPSAADESVERAAEARSAVVGALNRSVNVFHQRLWVGDHSMIAGGVAGPET